MRDVMQQRRVACGVWRVAVSGLRASSLLSVFLLFGWGTVTMAQAPPSTKRDTSWPMFRRTADLAGVASSPLPNKLKPKWKVTSKDGFASTAAIVGEHVFVGTLSGEMLCLKLATGEQVWSYKTLDKIEKNTFLPGFQSSPAVTAEAVFAGDEEGVFHAIDRKTGQKKWTFASNGQIIASANIVGDRLIFGSYDSSLYCLKTATGEQVWQYQTEDRVNGSPAVADKFTFVTGCDQHMRVINIETGMQETDMPLERFLIASPAVSGDLLFVGTHESEVICLNWRKKEIVWSYRDELSDQPYHSSAALTDKLVLIGGQDKHLHAIDRATGKGVWKLATRGQVNSSPVVVGDRVFVGSKDGFLYEVKLSDGKLIEKYQVPGRGISASPAVGEGCLVIGAEGNDGSLVCFGE
jgi:outer membrane protein assembly factor BamB